ncbi:MAG TPA: immunoglobulin domain-containing protein [Ohtaekwangia sp.]|uniref:immunoglobulin domain-containing protein n=1 Tax=Ohtaekwangia sp. TaxID=2066019 RepID=UPI002F943D1A
MKKNVLFFFAFTCVILSHAQNNNPNNPLAIPPITSPSPEVASLGKYGEVEVGEYTGTPDISIPLHTIKSGKLEFPLNLYYDASGVRVNQEATWVGLSWELSAVAGITYIPSGGNDQASPQIAEPAWQDWDNLVTSISHKIAPSTGHEDGYYGWGCSGNASPPVVTKGELMYYALIGKAQRDLYSVNCPGLSFKFYIHPQTGLPTVYGDKNALRVERYNNIGFKITDDHGVVYYFLVQEKTPIDSPEDFNQITHWYLTQIMNSDGELIKFKYANYGVVRPIPALSEQFTHILSGNQQESGMQFGGDRSLHLSSVLNQYLIQIESSREIIDFNLSNNRPDLSGSGARRLESIDITSKFSGKKKSFQFEYGYFSSSDIGGNYLADDSYWSRFGKEYTDSNLSSRLKLLSVIEKDVQNSTNRKYSFEYKEDILLPIKTSFAVDHWGYYNGQENQSNFLDFNDSRHTIIPTLFSNFLVYSAANTIVNGLDIYKGAIRGASAQYCNAGTLKSITYPTGGKSVFTYEPHIFKNGAVLSAEEESKVTHGVELLNVFDFNNGVPQTAYFILTTETEVRLSGNINNRNGQFSYEQMEGTFVRFSGSSFSRLWAIDSFVAGQPYSKTWDEKITLPPGFYVLSCDVPDAMGPTGYASLVSAVAEYHDKKIYDAVMAAHTESIGGGLRIKQIKNYDNNGTLVSSKEYKYVNEDGSSSGILIMPLTYTQSGAFTTAGTQNGSCTLSGLTYYKRNSSSLVGTTTSPLKATVGYSRVEIYDLTKQSKSENGTVIKTFSNNTAMGTFFNDVLINDADINGDLTSVTFKNREGNTIRTENYEYKISDIVRDWVNVKIADNYIGPVGFCTTGAVMDEDACSYIGRYTIGVYPYVNFKKLLIKKIETDLTNGQNVVTETNYKYDMTNYAVSEESTYDSKHQPLVTVMKYPHDFIAENDVYSSMTDANIISPVVEITKYKNGVQNERVRTNYFPFGNVIKPFGVEQQLRDFPSEGVISYSRYTYGNIAEYKTNNGVYTSFIYGYDHTLPVAKVVNAKLSDIFYTGFEDVNNDVVTGDSKTGSKSKINGFTQNLTGLTNGKYVLSYWLKVNGQWILQQSAVTVANGTATIAINSSQQVDDVRFFPEQALMTSYTYDGFGELSSITDANNQVIYYEYDPFDRLRLIRDNQGKILKEYVYHFGEGRAAIADCDDIDVNPVPTFTASNDNKVCEGSKMTLLGPSNVTKYLWAGPNGFSSTDQNPVVTSSATPNVEGTYTLTVTYNNGCTNSGSSQISLWSTPVITQQPLDVTVAEGGSVSLTAVVEKADSYQWYLNEVAIRDESGLSIQSVGTTNTLTIPKAAKYIAGQYRVKFSNVCGASVTSRSATVTVTN